MNELIITDLVTNDVIYITVLPEQFKVTYNNSFGSWNIIDLGEVKFPDGVELSGISWDSFFEAPAFANLGHVQTEHYQAPETYHAQLERIKIDGRPCRIMMTNTPINFDCYLESFTPTFQDEMGRMYYSVSWIQAKQIDVRVENGDSLIDAKIRYRVHVRDQGWTPWANEGEVAGTTGMCLRMEALEIQNFMNGVEIWYRSHLRDTGWTDWVASGVSGTVGESRRLEAVMIELRGTNAINYDVFYRLHVRDYGWLDWSKNGEQNGTTAQERRAEAIQITLCKKGQFFPSDQHFAFQSGMEAAGGKEASSRSDYNIKGTHTVKEGDTLWHIALANYGDGEQWPKLYEANKDVVGPNPNLIHPGQVIKIPA